MQENSNSSGLPSTEDCAFAFTKASGITSVEKWMASKTPVKMGGVGPGAFAPDNVIRIVKAALGLPIQLISGLQRNRRYPSGL